MIRLRIVLVSATVTTALAAVVVIAGVTSSPGHAFSDAVHSASSAGSTGVPTTAPTPSPTAAATPTPGALALTAPSNVTSTPLAPDTATPTPEPIAPPIAPPSDAQPIPGPQMSAMPTGTQLTRVLTVGDSIMRGFGLDPGEAWTEVMATNDGFDLTTRACDGAGFLAIGNSDECASDFAGVISQAASLDPQVVIIEGSSNDFGEDNSALAAETSSAVGKLRAQFPSAEIIGLSTLWGDTQPPAQIADIDAQVAQAVQAVNGTFVDIGQPLANQPQLMQADDVHPTTAGQLVVEAAIEHALDEAHLQLTE